VTENDVLATLIAAVTLVKLTTIGVRHRQARRRDEAKARTAGVKAP